MCSRVKSALVLMSDKGGHLTVILVYIDMFKNVKYRENQKLGFVTLLFSWIYILQKGSVTS